MQIVDLARKFNRKLDIGKGMQLSPEELALLASIGVNDLIQNAAAKLLREQCQKRVVHDLSTSAETTGSTSAPTAKTSKSRTMTQSPEESESLARALTISKSPNVLSMHSTSKTPREIPSVPPVDNHESDRGAPL